MSFKTRAVAVNQHLWRKIASTLGSLVTPKPSKIEERSRPCPLPSSCQTHPLTVPLRLVRKAAAAFCCHHRHRRRCRRRILTTFRRRPRSLSELKKLSPPSHRRRRRRQCDCNKSRGGHLRHRIHCIHSVYKSPPQHIPLDAPLATFCLAHARDVNALAKLQSNGPCGI